MYKHEVNMLPKHACSSLLYFWPGRVVQKPVKVNWKIDFSCIKMFMITTYVLVSLRLLKPKAEEQTIKTENHTEQLQNLN